MLDEVAVGVSVHDPETGDFIQVNDAFRRTFGFESTEDVGFEEIDPGLEEFTAERGRDLVMRAAESGHESFEWRNRTAEGEVAAVEVDLSPADLDGERRVIATVRDVSDENRRERELTRHRDFLRRTQEIADVGGWEVDLDTMEVSWSDEAYRIHGVDLDEDLTLDDTVKLYHPGDRERIRELVTRAERTGEGWDVELRLRRDGETRWLRALAELQEDEDGRYLRGAIQDVTGRKRRQRRYEAVFDHTYQFSVLLSPDGRVLEVNRAALEFVAADRDDVVGTRIWEHPFFPEEDRREIQRAFADATDGEFTRFEVTAEGHDRTAYLDASMRPVTDAEGEVKLIVGEGRDITRRRERERELQRTRDRLHKIFDSTPDAVYVHDSEGRIERVNQEACDRLGYDRDELLGMNVREIAADVDPEYLGSAWKDPGLQSASVEVEHRRKDGSHVPVQVNLTRLGEDEFLAVVRDITEIRERERQLREERDRFEEFASVVSHDLRNPLNVAQGRLDLALRTGDTSHLDDVSRAHDRMAGLIDDVLEMARHGAVSEITEVDLADVARRCWFNVDTGDASLSVEADVSVEADEEALIQAFENLYRNAVEHGGEEVEVTVGVTDDGFYVEDDGVGLTSDGVLEAGYSTSDDGTGLGLSIVKRVADAHGWGLDTGESDEGGARFEFRT
ncbi:MAG: PAS domain S-box protein [Halobacteriota archaeon]